MSNGSRELPSEHHVQLRETEYERVVAVEQHQVQRLAERFRQHRGELEAPEPGTEDDDPRPHQAFTVTPGCGTMRR